MLHGISGDKPKTRIDNLIQCNKEDSSTLLLAFHANGSTSLISMVYAIYGLNDYSESHLLRLVRFVLGIDNLSGGWCITMWGETKKVTTIYLWSWKYSSISHKRVLDKFLSYSKRIITMFKSIYLDESIRNNLLIRNKESN